MSSPHTTNASQPVDPTAAPAAPSSSANAPDLLTQLQTALDQFTLQCFSSLRYIHLHHDSAVPENSTYSKMAHEGDKGWIQPDEEEVFKQRQTELARDLVLKVKQIETLIATLPGIGISQEAQEERLKELQARLQEAEKERIEAVKERERARERLESIVVGLRRV
ncbi:hypothetical protein EX30DRAFT_338929 [Ascodesmis nigricans]|uniref:Mediator of RNA polymerase II transcription subunit 21 n=1 Tax=Ascodesmis nigricans TaxID=341454 RepID=A0A4S2N547_9PEZI|nr:hypothetical protein EX30DRAFT_338929 [Ascodesmis nigricans]